ncbi:hypothetical protein KAR91_33970 [Candidatus Pacearchaeota archaeon]|nr:hypothetical protein [Candidatus Pacearchaeota archaeon]
MRKQPNHPPTAPPKHAYLTDKEDYKFKLAGKRKWNGVNISIENKKGSVRSGIDPDGKPWSIKMKYAYGRIPRTEGNDGDNIDVIIGPDLDSDLVFIIHQTTPWIDGWDEDKCILGAKNKAQAEQIFKSMYNMDGFMGPIDTVSTEVFKIMLKESKKGKPLGSSKITDSKSFRDSKFTNRLKDAITNLILGILIEMEHTNDIHEAEKIAKDHLAEDPNYYLDPKNPFIQEVHEEIMELAKESEAVRGKDRIPEDFVPMDFEKRLDNLRERRAYTADANPLTELALTPLIKKLMAKLGFTRMRWIGRGWLVPVGMSEYSKFLTIIPMLKVFDLQLNKLGYHIRINPLGFYIEPVPGK